MTNKEFMKYVQDKKRQGVSESQIARGLGMSLAHFLGKLNGVEKELGISYDTVEKPKMAVAAESVKEPKPVSGFGDPDAVKAAFQAAEQKKQAKNDKMKKQKEKIPENPVEPEPEQPKVEEDLSWMD